METPDTTASDAKASTETGTAVTENPVLKEQTITSEKNVSEHTTIHQSTEVTDKDRSEALKKRIKKEGEEINLDERTEVLTSYDFTWLENRAVTIEIIEQLKEKRILFIQSYDEEYIGWALQRFTSVLEAEKLNLWPKADAVRRIKTGYKLPFYFWGYMQEKLPLPTIIVINDDNADYISGFLTAGRDKRETDYKTKLTHNNLFLICPFSESYQNLALLSRQNAADCLKNDYVQWKIPALRLEMMRLFKEQADNLLAKIKDEGLLDTYSEPVVYQQLKLLVKKMQQKETPDPDWPTNLEIKLREELELWREASNENYHKTLNLFKTGDPISKTLIFTTLFFPGLAYNDFSQLVTLLLGDKTEQWPDKTNKYTRLPRKLAEIWGDRDHCDALMSACDIKIILKDGIPLVQFSDPSIVPGLVKDITSDQFGYVTGVYEVIENEGLLFSQLVKDSLVQALTKFIVQVALKNTKNYDVHWLTGLFLFARHVAHLNTQEVSALNLEGLLRSFNNQDAFFRLMIERLKALMREMLMAESKIFNTTIKEFFNTLFNLRGVKVPVMQIAVGLYKGLNGADNFPETELLDYFRKAIEAGNWDEMYATYDMFLDLYDDEMLYEKMQKWITDPGISKNAWIKKLARLFQLDYCINISYRYFNNSDADKKYPLFSIGVSVNNGIGESTWQHTNRLPALVRDITNEVCIEAWEVLLHGRFGFENYIYYLEYSVTRMKLYPDRLDENLLTGISLAGDIIENWFYVLVANIINDDFEITDTTAADAFAAMVAANANVEIMRKIFHYWKRKGTIYGDYIILLKKSEKKDREVKEQIELLKKRRGALYAIDDLLRKIVNC